MNTQALTKPYMRPEKDISQLRLLIRKSIAELQFIEETALLSDECDGDGVLGSLIDHIESIRHILRRDGSELQQLIPPGLVPARVMRLIKMEYPTRTLATFEDLLTFTQLDILKVRGVGRKHIETFNKELRNLGLPEMTR